jgi:hypothetical protein
MFRRSRRWTPSASSALLHRLREQGGRNCGVHDGGSGAATLKQGSVGARSTVAPMPVQVYTLSAPRAESLAQELVRVDAPSAARSDADLAAHARALTTHALMPTLRARSDVHDTRPTLSECDVQSGWTPKPQRLRRASPAASPSASVMQTPMSSAGAAGGPPPQSTGGQRAATPQQCAGPVPLVMTLLHPACMPGTPALGWTEDAAVLHAGTQVAVAGLPGGPNNAWVAVRSVGPPYWVPANYLRDAEPGEGVQVPPVPPTAPLPYLDIVKAQLPATTAAMQQQLQWQAQQKQLAQQQQAWHQQMQMQHQHQMGGAAPIRGSAPIPSDAASVLCVCLRVFSRYCIFSRQCIFRTFLSIH